MSKTLTLSDEMYDKIISLSVEQTVEELYTGEEFFNPDDAFGGNFDDTYYGGEHDGRITLAKELVDSARKEAARG